MNFLPSHARNNKSIESTPIDKVAKGGPGHRHADFQNAGVSPLTIRKLFRQLQPTTPRLKYVVYTKAHHKFLLDVPGPLDPLKHQIDIADLQDTRDLFATEWSVTTMVFEWNCKPPLE